MRREGPGRLPNGGTRVERESRAASRQLTRRFNMRPTQAFRRKTASVMLVAGLLSTVGGAAQAETPTTLCEPEGPSKPVLTPNLKGECPTKNTLKYRALQLPGPTGLEQLNKILAHVTYVESGIAGKPTLEFSGVNVQLVNGAGATASVNGEGNLVIGYDENAGNHQQTGSHDLVLGQEQTFTSYGGVLAGALNEITAPFASVTGGEQNTAGGEASWVGAGQRNVASGLESG